MHLSITTNVTPTEKKWEKYCFEVFSQGLEEMHHDLSKDGEIHKLGDVNTTPLDLHTLDLHTSNFCFSINALYRINLERLLFVFVLVWFLWDHHTIIYIWEIYWKYGLKYLAWFFLYWEKRCLIWFLMTHIVAWFMSFFMSNNLQMLYHELCFIHVLMLYVISPCLTWIS